MRADQHVDALVTAAREYFLIAPRPPYAGIGQTKWDALYQAVERAEASLTTDAPAPVDS